jgi:hypothetical protein
LIRNPGRARRARDSGASVAIAAEIRAELKLQGSPRRTIARVLLWKRLKNKHKSAPLLLNCHFKSKG